MVSSGMMAYVGPGPGLTMLWAFLGLLGTIGLAILYLLTWPVRMMIRKARGVKEAAGAGDAGPGQQQQGTETR